MEIADEVKQVISKTLNIPAEQLKGETRLEDLGAQSLEVIEMVFSLEEKFDIAISVKPGAEGTVGVQVEGHSGDFAFTTIDDVVNAVKELVAAKGRK